MQHLALKGLMMATTYLTEKNKGPYKKKVCNYLIGKIMLNQVIHPIKCLRQVQLDR